LGCLAFKVNYLYTLLISFIASWFLLLLLKKPGRVPVTGGISLCLGFLLASTLNCHLDYPWQFKGLILGSLLIFLFGFLDDNHELSVISKFSGQIICTGILVLFDVRTHIVNIPEWLNILITFVWVIGITNAFNHLDVMDGLAGSAAAIISVTFFLVSGTSYCSAIFSLALLGSLLAFLIYNFPPAKIYMGNSGSHFLGFVLSGVALIISYAPLERRIALLSPILILGFPIFDTVFLILTRACKKKLPFNKSNDHLVMRFLILGYSKRKALLLMSAWTVFFCLCGLAVSRLSNFPGLLTVTAAVFISLVLGIKMWRVSIAD